MLQSTLQTAKMTVLSAARRLGMYAALRQSNWRNERLLILGYHGVSLRDEHLWRPGLFMPVDLFVSRLETLSRTGCTVLSLGDALNRLRSRTLPPMAVAITFDDGFYNFYRAALPVLKRFRYPVTVYLTSYYSFCEKPVFHLLCSYILWKGSGTIIDSKPFTGRVGSLDLRTARGVNLATAEIWNFARAARLPHKKRQQLAKNLADVVGVDWHDLEKSRVFNLMNKAELSQLMREGVDVQLHTHRHRMPNDKATFTMDLDDNRQFLRTVGQQEAKHFTYPSGVYRKEVFSWLAESGVCSATTCETGLVGPDSNCMCLPRLVDSPTLSGLEFESWLYGFRAFLPSRMRTGG